MIIFSKQMKRGGGFALVTTLIILVAVAVLGFSALYISSTSSFSAIKEREAARARLNAESGLDINLSLLSIMLQENPANVITLPEELPPIYLNDQELTSVQFKFHPLTDVSTDNIVIAMEGIGGVDARFVSELHAEVIREESSGSSDPSVFDQVIFDAVAEVFSSLNASGTVMDAFDSRIGPYNAQTNTSSELILRSNGPNASLHITEMSVFGSIHSAHNLCISVSGDKVIDGDIFANGDIRFIQPTTVNGSVFSRGNIVIGNGVTINGDVIALGKVESFATNARINGNVIAMGSNPGTGGPWDNCVLDNNKIVHYDAPEQIGVFFRGSANNIYSPKSILVGQATISGRVASTNGDVTYLAGGGSKVAVTHAYGSIFIKNNGEKRDLWARQNIVFSDYSTISGKAFAGGTISGPEWANNVPAGNSFPGYPLASITIPQIPIFTEHYVDTSNPDPLNIPAVVQTVLDATDSLSSQIKIPSTSPANQWRLTPSSLESRVANQGSEPTAWVTDPTVRRDTVNIPNMGEIRVIRTGDITVSSSHTLEVLGGDVILFVDGKFEVGGGATLEIAEGSSLTIITRSQVKVIEGGRIITKNDAPGFRVFSSYNGALGVEMSGGSKLPAAIYSPHTKVSLSGTGGDGFFGAVIAKDVQMPGGARIHYDVALRDIRLVTPQPETSPGIINIGRR